MLNKTCYRSIVAMTFLDKHKKKSVGTGILISKNLILSVAHNVFDKNQGYLYHELKVYFGVDEIAKDYF